MTPHDAATLITAITGFVLSLASCTYETVPPRAIPAPIQSAAVTPAVDAVREDSAKGREISGRLETHVDALWILLTGIDSFTLVLIDVPLIP